MRQYFATFALVVVSTLAPAIAHAQNSARLGEAGESCRARSDCAEGLMCVANTCRDPKEGSSCGATSECGTHLVCRKNQCVAPVIALQPPALTFSRVYASSTAGPVVAAELEPAWNHPFEDGSTRFFAGVTFAPGGFVALTDYGNAAVAGFTFALRLGALIGQNELSLDVAPATKVYAGGGKTASVAFSYAYYPRIGHNLYWSLRLNVGYLGGLDAPDSLTVGGSVLGVAYTWKHFLFELGPDTRYYQTFRGVSGVDAMFNLKVGYVF